MLWDDAESQRRITGIVYGAKQMRRNNDIVWPRSFQLILKGEMFVYLNMYIILTVALNDITLLYILRI